VKDLEARLAQYSDGKSSKSASLTRILEEMGYNIRRFDVGPLTGRGDGDPLLRNQRSISKVIDEIYEEYAHLFGPLPWLTPQNRPASSHPDTALNQGDILSLVEDDPAFISGPHVEESNNEPVPSTMDQLSQMNENLQSQVIENANNVRPSSLTSLPPSLPPSLFISSSCKIILWKMFLCISQKPS
jgi:hypothetical protein